MQRIYDRASGIIPNLIGEGIVPPQKEGQNYSATETYTKASQSMKEEIFEAELNRILKKYSDNPTMTEIMINNLFNNVKPSANFLMYVILSTSQIFLTVFIPLSCIYIAAIITDSVFIFFIIFPLFLYV